MNDYFQSTAKRAAPEIVPETAAALIETVATALEASRGVVDDASDVKKNREQALDLVLKILGVAAADFGSLPREEALATVRAKAKAISSSKKVEKDEKGVVDVDPRKNVEEGRRIIYRYLLREFVVRHPQLREMDLVEKTLREVLQFGVEISVPRQEDSESSSSPAIVTELQDIFREAVHEVKLESLQEIFDVARAKRQARIDAVQEEEVKRLEEVKRRLAVEAAQAAQHASEGEDEGDMPDENEGANHDHDAVAATAAGGAASSSQQLPIRPPRRPMPPVARRSGGRF